MLSKKRFEIMVKSESSFIRVFRGYRCSVTQTAKQVFKGKESHLIPTNPVPS